MLHKFDSKTLRPNKYLPKGSISLEKPKKKASFPNKRTAQAKKASILPTPPRVISIVQQKTEPPKRRAKVIHQEPELTRQFEQITRIYNQSQELENAEDCLYCFQNIEEAFGFKNNPAPKSALSRFSQKSVSQLPSIEEREEEYREQQLTTTVKKGRQRAVTGTRRKKNTHSVNEEKENSEISGRSRSKTGKGKRMAIDVAILIKSRSKTKSSMSHRAPSRK